MRSWFIIPIMTLLVLQSINLNLVDLVKIPVLIEHYNQHQEEYGDDFFSFLDKHYGHDKEEHNTEHSEHQDLPFHHSLQFLTGVEWQYSTVFSWKHYFVFESSHYFVYKAPHSASAAISINQPPQKTC